MPKPPKRDPLGAFHREALAERRLGNQKECASCGETRALALEQNTNPRLCTECRREKQGQTIFDDHHIAGQANSDVTTPIPANQHRAQLSEDQKDWPRKTLENRDGDPLLAAAARNRGVVNCLSHLIDVLLPNTELQEALHQQLVEQHGSEWWRNTKVEKFARKRRNKNVNS